VHPLLWVNPSRGLDGRCSVPQSWAYLVRLWSQDATRSTTESVLLGHLIIVVPMIAVILIAVFLGL